MAEEHKTIAGALGPDERVKIISREKLQEQFPSVGTRLERREANREALKQFQRPGRKVELPWLWTPTRSKYQPHSRAKEQAKHLARNGF